MFIFCDGIECMCVKLDEELGYVYGTPSYLAFIYNVLIYRNACTVLVFKLQIAPMTIIRLLVKNTIIIYYEIKFIIYKLIYLRQFLQTKYENRRSILLYFLLVDDINSS